MSRHLRTLSVMIISGFAALMSAGTWADAILHARVSFDAGGSMVKGAEDSDWSHATINTLVLPGDTLWVDQGGTSEIEFSGGAFLRMADGSKAEVSSVAPAVTIRGWEGSFYLQRLARSSGDLVFVAPSATIQIEQDTAARVDIVDQAVTITVRWGRASIRTDVGSPVIVSGGERVWVDPGLLPSNPTPFDRNEEDGFDVWNRERAESLATGYSSVPADVATSAPIGASDLGNYGEWVSVENRSYWRPTVVTNYVPYRYGYWSSTPRVGYSWVGHYPFSYVTSHYGRWSYFDRYGWCWNYDPVWAPAWAATVRCGDYLVWTPVDYYYRPVYGVGSSFFSVGGLSFSVFASSYAPLSHIGLGPQYIYGVNNDISRYIYSHHGDVHIWNINLGDRNHVRVPYERNLDQVRIYNPRRSIRGPLNYGDGTVLASQRVQQLESRFGRDRFSAIDRTGRENVRTDASAVDRSARLRSVRVNQEEPSFVRANSRNPEDAAVAATRSVRVPRSRDIAGSEDTGSSRGVRGGETTPERGEAARRSAEDARRSPLDTRTPADVTLSGRGVRNDPESAGRTPAGEVSRERGGEAPDRGRTPSVRASDAQDSRSSVRGTTPRVEPGARSSGSSEVTRTPVRSGPPSMTTPDRERMTTPSVRGNSAERSSTDRRTVRVETPASRTPERSSVTSPGIRSSASTDSRTPVRSGPANVSAPDRTLSSESDIRRPRVITSGPDRSPERSAPRTVQSPATSIRQTPSRIATPTVPSRSDMRINTPSSSEAPRFERPAAPQVRMQEPSRSIERSTPNIRASEPVRTQEAPRMERPNIQRSAPSIQRSAPSIQRSAPSIERSAPQVSAPSRQAAPPVSRGSDGGGRGGGREVRGR